MNYSRFFAFQVIFLSLIACNSLKKDKGDTHFNKGEKNLSEKKFISAKQFGTIGDNKFDNKFVFQKGISYVSSIGGGVFYIDEGKYKSSPIHLENIKDVTIKGTKGTCLIAINPGTLRMDRNLLSFSTNCKNIKIEKIEFDGDFHNQTPASDLNKTNHLLTIGIGDEYKTELSCSNFEIMDCKFQHGGLKRTNTTDNGGDGIYVFANNISIYDNYFKNTGRWHIAQTGGNNIKIFNNTFIQDSSQIQGYGLFDFEFNGYLPTKSGKNILIYDNEVFGISLISFNTDEGYLIEDVEIYNNQFNIRDEKDRIPQGNTILEAGFNISNCRNIKIYDNKIKNEICSGYSFRIQNVSNISIFRNEIVTNAHVWLEKNIKDFDFFENYLKIVNGAKQNFYGINFTGVNLKNIKITDNSIYSEKNASPIYVEKGGINIHILRNKIGSKLNRESVIYVGPTTYVSENTIIDGSGRFQFVLPDKNSKNIPKNNNGKIDLRFQSN
jgi:hypothetical protein